MKRRVFRTLSVLLIAGLFLTACQGGRNGSNPDEATDEEAVFAVNVTSAVQGEIFDYLEVNGDVVAESSVDVFADTSGKLLRLAVSVGDYVRKDQTIASVDPSRPGQTFAPSPVKSPINGTITRIPGDIGATISPAIPVATVSNVESLEIATGVSERYIGKIQQSQSALVELEAYPDLRFAAFVSEISPVVDPITRSMAVTLALVEQEPRIKAGMFAKISIIIEEKQNIVKIPAECMVTRSDIPYVFVVTDERVEAREIVPGIQIDNKLEVTQGLAPGEVVVIRGQTLLEDGAGVKIIDTIPPLTESDTLG